MISGKAVLESAGPIDTAIVQLGDGALITGIGAAV
jgi:hypothetical protein